MSKIKKLALPKTCDIVRKKWVRGQGSEESALLVENKISKHHNKMCCLGFLALAAGASRQDISGHLDPVLLAEWSGEKPLVMDKLVTARHENYSHTSICYLLMRINDDVILSEEQREEQLTEQFAKIGVKVKFV